MKESAQSMYMYLLSWNFIQLCGIMPSMYKVIIAAIVTIGDIHKKRRDLFSMACFNVWLPHILIQWKNSNFCSAIECTFIKAPCLKICIIYTCTLHVLLTVIQEGATKSHSPNMECYFSCRKGQLHYVDLYMKCCLSNKKGHLVI